MTTFIIAVLSITFSVMAQFLLKSGVQGLSFNELNSVVPLIRNWKVLAGFACYSTAAIIWLRVLSEWDVSKAYPMMGLGFIMALLVGILYGEVMTTTRIIGIATIFAGVLIISKS